MTRLGQKEKVVIRSNTARLRGFFARVFVDDRGDVPGWVLITLMTAGLVVLIWALAGPALGELFERAIEQVSGI
jgi:hypothetical protein